MPAITDADIDAIVGHFLQPDRDLFRVLLTATQPLGGDLAELGVLYGASAVLVGESLQDGETFTVVDLFEGDAADDANAVENSDSYPGLDQAAFEDNYRRLHGVLPVVVKDFSERVTDHARHGSHRFVHIDASHLYEHVVKDIEAARVLLKDDGIVVLDDIRQEHTPGVAAAAWQAVTGSGLRPFAITAGKLYATWGDATAWRQAAQDWVVTTDWSHEVQQVNGHDLLRVFRPVVLGQSRHPWKKFVPEVAWPALAGVRRTLGRS